MNHTPIMKMSRCAHVVFAALLTCMVGNVSSFAATDTRYYVNDHLATTVGIADATGEIAALEADAFGSPLAGAAKADRFTGKPYDEDLGAYVFPFRNYRADEARWMSADPSGFPDGVSNTSYRCAVFVSIDPWGLASVTVYAYGPGDTSADGGASGYGHVWSGVTTDDGKTTVIGHYPGGPKDDSLTKAMVSHTFDISDAAAAAARGAQQNPGEYGELTNNCVDALQKVLNAAGINSPSFNSFFIGQPKNVIKWLNKLNAE